MYCNPANIPFVVVIPLTLFVNLNYVESNMVGPYVEFLRHTNWCVFFLKNILWILVYFSCCNFRRTSLSEDPVLKLWDALPRSEVFSLNLILYIIPLFFKVYIFSIMREKSCLKRHCQPVPLQVEDNETNTQIKCAGKTQFNIKVTEEQCRP